LKFDGQLRTGLKKSKTNDQIEKEVNVKTEIDQIRGQIEEIESLLIN
jgi:uncharacterized protein YicC (UPF0701 family)